MLKEIIITKLFNHFDYRLRLKEEGITILTGPNGYGKTTILNIINAIATNNIFFFSKLLFQSISLVYEDNKHNLTIEKKDNNSYIVKQANKTVLSFNREVVRKELNNLALVTSFKQLDEHRWLDRRTDSVLSAEAMLQKLLSDDPEIFSSVKNIRFPHIPDVYLIKEQRLLRKPEMKRRSVFYQNDEEPTNNFIETIEEYAKDLQTKITEVLSVYSQKTSELDGSYPSRLFEQTLEVSEDEFKKRFEKIKLLQKNIDKYAIAEIKEENHPTYKPKHAQALFVYLDDTEQKLSVFKELLAKLDLFTGLLDKREFTFKKIEISKNYGFRFITNKGEYIALTDLSSGEQHEVVLLYELLFKVPPGTMVLIDDPEISLHVAWQQEFINDLKRIKDINGIVAIVATHSPTIINNDWSLVQDLYTLSKI